VRLLRGQAELYTDPRLPAGCFLIQGAAGARLESQNARLVTSQRRRANEQAIIDRLGRAPAVELPMGMTPRELAGYVTSIGNGLAIRAGGGNTREQLYRIIELSLAFWPEQAGDAPAAVKARAGQHKPKAAKMNRRRT
jgi:hypothetical protein